MRIIILFNPTLSLYHSVEPASLDITNLVTSVNLVFYMQMKLKKIVPFLVILIESISRSCWMQFSARQRSGPLEYTRVFYYQAFQVGTPLCSSLERKKVGGKLRWRCYYPLSSNWKKNNDYNQGNKKWHFTYSNQQLSELEYYGYFKKCIYLVIITYISQVSVYTYSLKMDEIRNIPPKCCKTFLVGPFLINHEKKPN